ncbi:MAG: calcium-binding protein, partial [Symploca sp. SIO1A3]|nr:calcium-binding protein [Symploca sp. SIO1A3]
MNNYSLISTEGLEEYAQVALDAAILKAQDLLKAIASGQDFTQKFTIAFGNDFDLTESEYLRQQWEEDNFESLPDIEIRSSAVINGANGAFSADTNTIYLSQEYLTQNASSPQAIANLLLEEIGHSVDSQINTSDASGDEGAIFSALAQGMQLEEGTLQALKAENDLTTVTLNGQTIQIEQAEPTFNVSEILSGLKDSLDNIQNKVNALFKGQELANTTGITGSGLPFLGNDFTEKAQAGGQFVQEFYEKIEEKFESILGSATEATKSQIQDVLLEAFGSSGLDILKDSNNNGMEQDDIKVEINEFGVLTVDFDLGGEKSLANVALPKNLGLPQLGLEFQEDTNLGIDLDYTFDFGFDFNPNSNDKFSFNLNTDPNDKEITIKVTPNIPKISANFGFLTVDATDIGTGLNFSVDLSDANNDNKLKLGESLSYTPEGSAAIKLNFISSLGESAVIPKIGTDLNLQWAFTKEAKPTISFDNSKLYLGSFLTDFIKPIVDPITAITEPIYKATSFLTERIGILDTFKLGGPDRNLLGLARQFNPTNPTLDNVEKALNAIAFVTDLSTLVDQVDSTVEDIGINLGKIGLGSFDLTSGTSINGASVDAAQKSLAELEQDFNNQLTSLEADNPGISSKFQAQKDFFSNKDSVKSFFSIPILDNPSSAIGLLLGQNVDFFKFDLPDFDFKTGIKGSFRIPAVPILEVDFKGEIGGKLNLGFGYDSNGIQEWAKAGYKSSEIDKIFDGFFIDDNRVSPTEDLPEFTITGKLEAGVGPDIVVAEAKVTGGIEATVNIDLEDQGEFNEKLGESDGKIRPSEFLATLENHPGCLFDIGGQLDAYLGYYLRVGFPPFGKEWSDDLARTRLADFGLETCPDEHPRLANEGPETFKGGTLDINIGLRAKERLFINTIDNNEIFLLQGTNNSSKETVTISALGYTQNYAGVNKIVANAGELDDVIEVEKIVVPVEFSGGSGNDQLSGGEGNDVINGDSGDDRLFGGGGDDLLSGASGNDVIFAGDGNDSVSGGDNTNNPEDKLSGDQLFGEAGNDTIDGGAGNDFIKGGTGNDQLYGDSDNSQAGQDIILGGEDNDELYGLAGNDTLTGGDGLDSLYGGIGDDELLGNASNDFLKGEEGNDRISGEAGEDTVSYNNSPDGVIVNIDENQGYTNAGGETNLEPLFTINAAEAEDGFGTKDTFSFTTTRVIYDEATETISEQQVFVFGSLENIIGSEFNDILIGNNQNNRIEASTGDDLLIGNGGDDYLDGGDNIDTVSYRHDSGSVYVNLDETQSYQNPGGYLHTTIVSDSPIPTDTQPNFTLNA